MIPQTLFLSVFISVIGISHSADPIQVISGVFMPNNISVDYDGARTACAMQYSRLATLADITFAFRNGYEFCKWGWIEEHRLVMLRLTPFENCAGYNVGILIRDCPRVTYTFCVGNTGPVLELPIPSSLVPSYENASNTCTNNGSYVATKEQIDRDAKTMGNSQRAWYNWGVGQVKNGTFEEDTCTDILSQGSAFCYNPALSDVLTIDNTRTWKKIGIGCALAFIFLILLLTAAFMRSNRCICCMDNKQTQDMDNVVNPVPTWNKTSIYRRISHLNKETIYDNMITIEKRPPVIRPDMSIYKMHYLNMAFDKTGEE